MAQPSIAFGPLLVILFVGLVLVGGLVGIVLLIANPKTRVAGVVLLLIGPVLLAFGLVTIYFVRVEAGRSMEQAHIVQQQAVVAQRQQMAEAARAQEESGRVHGPLMGEGPTDATAPAAGPAQPATPVPLPAPPSPPGAQPGEHGAPPPTSPSAKAVDKPADKAADTSPGGAEETASGKRSTTIRALAMAIGRAIAESTESRVTPPAKTKDVAQPLPSPPVPPAAKTAPNADQTTPAPPPRPAWVDAQPSLSGDVYQTVIVVGPYSPRATRQEYNDLLEHELRDVVSQYVKVFLGPEAAGRVALPRDLAQRIIKEQWQETIQASFGPMTQTHVLLKFDRSARDRLQQAWKDAIIAERIWYASVGLTTVLGLLAVLFAGLKIDQAAAGAHRGWLCLAGLLLAVAIVGLGALAVQLVIPPPLSGEGLPLPVQPTSSAAPYDLAAPQTPQAAMYPAKLALLLPAGLLLVGGILVLLVNKRTRLVGVVAVVAVVVVTVLLVYS